MAYYRQPEFFRNFRCMGGKCPNSCCAIWRIDWEKEEVEKLKSADCSPELRRLIEESFVQVNDNSSKMVVKLRAEHKLDCPFLTEDRMCRIQRELGEEFLSHTCRSYPRTMFFADEIVTRTCSASCYQVMDILRKDPDAMKLVSAPFEAKQVYIHPRTYANVDQKKYPEIKYHNQLFEFFYEIISNKNRTLETSLVLGALAAQKLTEYISRGEYDRIPEIIKALRPQLNSQTISSFENTKPNYNYSVCVVKRIIDTFATSDVLDNLFENGVLNPEKYEQGRSIFQKYTDENPHILRNIALNFLIEGDFPFINKDHSLFDNYCYYVSTIAAVRLIGGSISQKSNSVKDGMFISISYFVRGMYHALNKNTELVHNILQESGCKSPAFIALMLK